MFEQATLTNGPAGKRVWTTMLGMTTQVALVSFAVLAPMVWPQVLPTGRILETIAPPLPPAPKHLGGEVKQRAGHPVRVKFDGRLYEPQTISTKPIPIIVDEPIGQWATTASQAYSGPTVGLPYNFSDPSRNVVPIIEPPVARTSKPATVEPVAVIPRYKEGGNVKLGAALNKVQPPYPPLARATHIFGNVELECVVGVDGRIHEVKVRSGNPLLVRAAVDAAWQWVYAPSKLNDVPIEIVTIMTFSFKLN